MEEFQLLVAHGLAQSGLFFTSLGTTVQAIAQTKDFVDRITNGNGLLTMLGGILSLLVYLRRTQLHPANREMGRVSPRQERAFMRIACLAEGESVDTQTFERTREAQRFFRQVQRLVFDSGISIEKSEVELRTETSAQYGVVIGVPNPGSLPNVAKVLSRAFKSIGVEARIVAKNGNPCGGATFQKKFVIADSKRAEFPLAAEQSSRTHR